MRIDCETKPAAILPIAISSCLLFTAHYTTSCDALVTTCSITTCSIMMCSIMLCCIMFNKCGLTDRRGTRMRKKKRTTTRRCVTRRDNSLALFYPLMCTQQHFDGSPSWLMNWTTRSHPKHSSMIDVHDSIAFCKSAPQIGECCGGKLANVCVFAVFAEMLHSTCHSPGAFASKIVPFKSCGRWDRFPFHWPTTSGLENACCAIVITFENRRQSIA